MAITWRVMFDHCVECHKSNPRSQILIYEDLKADPLSVVKPILSSVGLEVSDELVSFVSRSTNGLPRGQGNRLFRDSKHPFYSVYRHSDFDSSRWQTALEPGLIERVRHACGFDDVKNFWPDQTTAH